MVGDEFSPDRRTPFKKAVSYSWHNRSYRRRFGIFFGTPASASNAYGLSLAYIWSGFLGYVLTHNEIEPHVKPLPALAASILPLLFIMAYSFGVVDARSDLVRSETRAELFIKLGKDEQPQRHEIVVLRLLDKGALVREGLQIEFFDWKDVASLRAIVIPFEDSHSCKDFRYLL